MVVWERDGRLLYVPLYTRQVPCYGAAGRQGNLQKWENPIGAPFAFAMRLCRSTLVAFRGHHLTGGPACFAIFVPTASTTALR